MAGLRALRLLAVAMAVVALASPAPVVSGQQVAGPLSCTASLVSSFAPCLNFIINNTASPTADCCRSLGALMKASTGCACLILTGSVPLGVPVNRTMAVTLPRACNNASVPLQCQDATTSAQTPAPGPVADAPAPSSLAPAPLPPLTAPVATPVPEAPAPATATATPVLEPTATPPVSQGQTRPTVVPSSAWRRASAHVWPAVALLLAGAGAAMV
ncbi:protein YLS3-like [Panicum miliaceum]|uniref:Protein YLS3-like n=1 Tax=Panicum miliaceum TaxID=4540 RepID=A0A3L6T9E1_PANMI|nr:protein YLS3-like [Panicum miliaceum]